MIKDKKINFLFDEFKNSINSHSYIFYTNDFESCLNDVLELCKLLFNVEKLENINNDLIIINSLDKKNILKENLLTIKNTFLTKSYINKYRVYLIEEAHKLNSSSSNVILKFLEEPEEGIIGFFITTQLDSVLSTIKSRCQIINCFYDSKENVNEENYKIIDSVFCNPICYNIFEFKKKYFENFERNDLINFFKKYLDYCYKKGLNNEKECKKILIINNFITKLINNINIDYAFDYLFLESSDI